MSEWISVEIQVPPLGDEDPDCTDNYLVWTEPVWTADNDMVKAFYSHEDAEWYDMKGDMVRDVTHWRELPDPPQ